MQPANNDRSYKVANSNPNFWLPLTDTLLTSTPKYGSSNMVKMRKFVEDVRGAVSADAEGEYSDNNTIRVMMQDLDAVKQRC